MLFPGELGKKFLKDSGISASEKTLQRIRNDLRNLGIEHLIKEAHRLYLLTVISSYMDAMKLKSNMFSIVTSSSAENFEKIKAGQVILQIIKELPELYDPAVSESISKEDDGGNTEQTSEQNENNANNNSEQNSSKTDAGKTAQEEKETGSTQ